MSKQVPPEIQALLKQVWQDCEKEDQAARERQIRTWRQLKLLWEGFSRVWYSETAHDWRIWDDAVDDNTGDQGMYDKPVNVLRAYLESIIAALSVTVPPVKCYPDDADNGLDISTAKAGDKVAQLIYRHNDVSMLWLHALFIYCTEGMVAFHTYPDTDEDYGTYKEQKYKDVTENHQISTCPQCGVDIDDRLMSEVDEDGEEFMPETNEEETPSEMGPDTPEGLMGETELCPNCQQMMTPEISQKSFTVNRLVDEQEKPKTRMCLDAYGGLYVKIPNYARKQKDCPYLILSYESDYSLVVEEYEHLHANPQLLKNIPTGAGAYEQYSQWGRLSPQYRGEYPSNVVTCSYAWMRPAKFNILKDKKEVDALKKMFPHGVKAVFINGEFAEACDETLDDYWTITHNPLSDYLHFDPLGLLLVSVQEITNDLLSLTVQTIEQGVGLTFANPKTLNFKGFAQTEVTPGGVFPATPPSGKALSDGFYQIKTATLSSEVMPFAQQIQSLGQLVTGALPSLFGGSLQGAETASQYSMSRAQALQRLQNTWKMFTTTWKTVFGKAIPMYIKNIHEDERDVQRTPEGGFINSFIRKAELEGKIGKVELEANENLPLTWSQRKDIVMQLLQSANPEVLAILGAPENLPVVREAIGLPEFYIPNEDEVEATYDDIKALLGSEPYQVPPDMMMVQQAQMTGMPPPPPTEQPSIQPDPDIDTPELRFRVLKGWLLSEAGRMAKVDNEPGYRNVLLYAKAFKTLMMPPPMPMAPPDGKGAVPAEKPNNPALKAAPITGEGNVETVN